MRESAPSPFHTMFIDTVQITKTPRGNEHLVCVTDLYSRYITAWPTKDIQAKTIARQFFDKIISIHGSPSKLFSDNGSCFVGAIFKELCNLYGIKQIFGPSFYPQAQGPVERGQRSILTLMRNYVTPKQTDWDIHLPAICFALNTSDTYMLGYSPYFLTHGRHPTLPSEISLPDTDHTKTVKEQLADILHSQSDAHGVAAQHLATKQAKMKEHFDKHANDRTIEVGDIVYIHLSTIKVPKTKRKLQPQYHGPYVVCGVKTRTTVMLRRLSDNKYLVKPISVTRLRKGHLRSEINKWDPLPPVTEDPDEIALEEDDLPDSSFTPPVLEKENDNPTTPDNLPSTPLTQPTPDINENNQEANHNDNNRNPNIGPPRVEPPKAVDGLAACKNTRLRFNRVYYPVKNVTDVCIMDNETRYLVIFNDDSACWLPYHCLNEAAQKHVDEKNLQPRTVPKLRNRSKTNFN